MANELEEAPSAGSDRLTSVDNALWLLQLVAERQALRVSEAADLLGVARPPAHRLLTALRRRDFLMQDKPNGAYRPGPALHAIGMVAISRLDVRRIAKPALEQLRDKTKRTASLAALADGELGRRSRVEELPAPTPASITVRHELMRELGQIRRQGYALNWEESSDGVAAVAVAVRDASGIPIASISVSVPSMRLGSIAGIRALAPHVLDSAEQIHEQLHRAG